MTRLAITCVVLSGCIWGAQEGKNAVTSSRISTVPGGKLVMFAGSSSSASGEAGLLYYLMTADEQLRIVDEHHQRINSVIVVKTGGKMEKVVWDRASDIIKTGGVLLDRSEGNGLIFRFKASGDPEFKQISIAPELCLDANAVRTIFAEQAQVSGISDDSNVVDPSD